MSVKTTTFITAGMLILAADVLNATATEQQEVRQRLTTALVADAEGNLTWRPSAHGLNKYKVVLPKKGISQAIRYQDTSDLFYLSEISESALTISPNNGLWADLLLSPTLSSLDLNWPISKISYGGLQLVYESATKFSASVSGHITVASTPYSFHDVGLSFGDKNKLTASGAILNMGETNEQFYVASVSDSQTSKYLISYGLRTWDTFDDFNTAWVAGVTNVGPFASFQLERDIKKGFWFMQIASQSGKQPRFGIGAQYDLNSTKSGSWRIVVSSLKDLFFAPSRPTLATHRRKNLSNLWRPAVTVESIRSVEHAH